MARGPGNWPGLLWKEGLILLTCGSQGATVRVLVPLTIADADLDAGLTILTDLIARS